MKMRCRPGRLPRVCWGWPPAASDGCPLPGGTALPLFRADGQPGRGGVPGKGVRSLLCTARVALVSPGAAFADVSAALAPALLGFGIGAPGMHSLTWPLCTSIRSINWTAGREGSCPRTQLLTT